MSSLQTRNNYSPYSKANAQESQQLPLRNRAYSHLDNISHHSSQYNSYNNPAMDDKVTGIKRKYEKISSNPRSKGNEENFKDAFDFGKPASAYEANDEPSQYRKACLTPTVTKERKPSTFQPDFSKNSQGKPSFQTSTSTSYGRVQIKSQLQSNRMALNAMRNQLQAKLSELNNKTKASSYPAYRPFQEKHTQSVYQEPVDSYEAILSKYSKNTDYLSGKFNDDTNKSDAFNDTATINSKQKYTSKTDHKPAPSLNEDKYSNLSLRAKPEEVSRSYLKSNTYETNYSKMEKIKEQQQRINLEFTLQKKEPQLDKNIKEENTYLSKYFADKNKAEKQSKYRDYKYQTSGIDVEQSRNTGIYYPQKSSFRKRSQLHQLEELRDRYDFGTKSTQMPSNQADTKSPAKAETRDNQTISKEIERLDMKIKQIEQNKKQLNINFKPYDPSSLAQRSSKTKSQFADQLNY